MSNPVTHVEIEDVLSSIRKLVSADERPAKKALDSADVQVGKLVLTPSLRVDDAAPAESEAWQSHDQPEPVQSEPKSDQEFHAPEVETQPQGDDGDHAQDVFAEAPQDTESAGDHAWGEEDVLVEDHGVEDDVIVEGDDENEAYWKSFEDVAPDSLTARVAEFEKAVAARDDGWEPDGSAPDENAAEPTAALPWQDHVPDASGTAESFDAEVAEAVSTDDHAHDPFMSMAAGMDDTSYEDDEAASDPGPSAAATTGPANAFLSDEDLLDDGSEAFLDEETLRDLVAEIVRQELQGSLGERITRNVRKLVRREIQRALAAQDLE